jgi:YidC/Oxa1 family membrane protein insertase
MQQRNFLLFIALSCLFFAGWLQVKLLFFPNLPAPPKPKPFAQQAAEEGQGPAALGLAAGPAVKLLVPVNGKPAAVAIAAGSGATLVKRSAAAIVQAPPPAPAPRLPQLAEPTPDDKLVVLGSADPRSPFHLQVRLDPRGAGVRSVVLNKFQAADHYGRPVWIDRAKHEKAPLELVPADANRDTPANVLYHFRTLDDTHPLDTLGKVAWTIVDRDVKEGATEQRVSFQTTIQGVRITKIFSLRTGEYHVGLEVKLSRPVGEDGSRKFRYQLAGARGLPVEGRWYTSIFRNALIAQVDPRGNVDRDMQDLRQIGHWEGGNEILKQPGYFLRYAAVAVQYFTSAIVVDNQQKTQDFLKQARPTLEEGVWRGQVKRVDRQRNTLVVTSEGRDREFVVTDPNAGAPGDLPFIAVQEGMRLAVVFQVDGDGRSVVNRLAPELRTHPLWYEDITVRVSTEPIEVRPGPDGEVVHKYLLYNGPVKPSLLLSQSGEAAVDPALVDRYAYTLSLNTLTDYHSPGAMGRFSSAIYWTSLIIKCTNLMHAVLGMLYWIVPSYGLCIVLLTVMVRGLMFPVSRKQAMTSIKMQELAPEMKKIQEKHKDDRQALGVAQMELYRKHGVNPFGTCWLLLLQMPIFMGLYFALQESIRFRLAPFWPTWIVNLAAPDMMIWWGENIPVLSRPEDYGGILYLGPFFNLLPVVAVVLMLVQQKMMTPPPTDEQQQMQQSMMKYMMVFFGLMFYKVAAGLCIYFTASSLWGLAERKLLPKRLTTVGGPGGDGAALTPRGPTWKEPALAARAKARKPERGRRDDEPATPLRRLRDWWAEVLRQAEKK